MFRSCGSQKSTLFFTSLTPWLQSDFFNEYSICHIIRVMKSTPPMNLSVRTKPSNHTSISNSFSARETSYNLVTNMPMVARHQLILLSRVLYLSSINNQQPHQEVEMYNTTTNISFEYYWFQYYIKDDIK